MGILKSRTPLAAVLALLTLLGSAGSGLAAGPAIVNTGITPDGRHVYLVNGVESLFVGMGYNPIYRHLPAQTRQAMYRKDFIIMCRAGINTITGWDADKGYDQDKFDELTLDTANQYGIGVVMPVYLPPEADYRDPSVVATLAEMARLKVERFKRNPGVRMWGIGNEVMNNMVNSDMRQPFVSAYVAIADMVHEIDTNHPIIYREAEDDFVPLLSQALHDGGNMRPWLLYGMNVYDKPLGPVLDRWPTYDLNRPLFVSEFGVEAKTALERAQGYARMWLAIRGHQDWVAGGAPYAWTTAGPEPTDPKWGLMDRNSWPVDATFATLQQMWRSDPRANHGTCA